MPLPKHEKLRNSLLAEIRRKGLSPHAPFASEREIIARTGFSQPTVRHALGDLVEQGVLYRVQGRGTFVAPPAKTRNLWVVSHLQGSLGNRSMGLTRFLTHLWENPQLEQGPWSVQHMPWGALVQRGGLEALGSGLPHAVVVYRSFDVLRDFTAGAGSLPFPVLFYGSSAWERETAGRPAILVDEGAIVREAVAGFVSRGRRKLAVCFDPERPVESRRTDLFMRAAAQAGLSVAGTLPKPVSRPAFLEALKVLGPDGIFGATDGHGAGILAALALSGRPAPVDQSVISVDNYPFARYLAPALSSVDPRDDLGAEAVVEWLHEEKAQLPTAKTPWRRTLSKPELMRRESL